MKSVRIARLLVAVGAAVVLTWVLTWGAGQAVAWEEPDAHPQAAPILKITGPSTGKVNVPYTFTGSFDSSVGTPITYEWRATSQGVVTYTGVGMEGLKHSVPYTWAEIGTKVITLRAYNNITVSKIVTHFIDIDYHRVYLPSTLRRWPPLPYKPILSSIENADLDGNYTVRWTEEPTRLADTYYLREATDEACAVKVVPDQLTDQQYVEIVNKQSGVYYYCVQGCHNTAGCGAWSNVEKVEVGSPIYIDYIQFKPPSGGLIKEEYVLIKNQGDSAQVMTGWRLEGEFYNTTYNFPSGFVLPANGEVRVWSLNEKNTATDLYWGTWGQNWFDNGDTARLYDDEGNLVDTYTY